MLNGEGSTCTFVGVDVMFLDEELSFDSLEESMEWGKLGSRYVNDRFHINKNSGFCNYRFQLKFSCMQHIQLQICELPKRSCT
jgi:hypothetical protein